MLKRHGLRIPPPHPVNAAEDSSAQAQQADEEDCGAPQAAAALSALLRTHRQLQIRITDQSFIQPAFEEMA